MSLRISMMSPRISVMSPPDLGDVALHTIQTIDDDFVDFNLGSDETGQPLGINLNRRVHFDIARSLLVLSQQAVYGIFVGCGHLSSLAGL